MNLDHEAWLKQAQRDLEAAEHLQQGGYHEWACYGCQQAVEKAVKSIWRALGLEHPTGARTGHDLTELFKAWSDLVGGQNQDLADGLATLTPYVKTTRYPNGGGVQGIPCEMFGEAESDAALDAAKKLLELCKTLAEKAAEFTASIQSIPVPGTGAPTS